MANTERTTLTFDKETRQRLQTLAARWQVSQAEVVRRAVARAEEVERMASDPVAVLLAFSRGSQRRAAGTHGNGNETRSAAPATKAWTSESVSRRRLQRELGGRALRDFAGLDKPMIYYAPKRCNGLGFLVEEVFKETRVI